jgi:hypothetical protein
VGSDGIPAAHEHAGDERKHDAAGGCGFSGGFTFAVGRGIKDDGESDKRNSTKQEQGIRGGVEQIAGDCADDQRQSDADREGYSEAGDVDGGNKEQIGDVEDYSTGNGKKNCVGGGVGYGVKEGWAGGAEASGGESLDECGEQEADGVIPVEELEAVAGAELERIGPRPPAGHAEDHEKKSGLVGCGEQHGWLASFNGADATNNER